MIFSQQKSLGLACSPAGRFPWLIQRAKNMHSGAIEKDRRHSETNCLNFSDIASGFEYGVEFLSRTPHQQENIFCQLANLNPAACIGTSGFSVVPIPSIFRQALPTGLVFARFDVEGVTRTK